MVHTSSFKKGETNLVGYDVETFAANEMFLRTVSILALYPSISTQDERTKAKLIIESRKRLK